MTFNLKSAPRFNGLVNGLALAGLLAAGASAMAQGTAPAALSSWHTTTFKENPNRLTGKNLYDDPTHNGINR